MKKFESPEIEIVKFINNEVISTSFGSGTGFEFPDEDEAEADTAKTF